MKTPTSIRKELHRALGVAKTPAEKGFAFEVAFRDALKGAGADVLSVDVVNGTRDLKLQIETRDMLNMNRALAYLRRGGAEIAGSIEVDGDGVCVSEAVIVRNFFA